MSERRFPIQSDLGNPAPTSCAWSIADKAYSQYRTKNGQSLERVAERGGFSANEMDNLYPSWRDEESELAAAQARLAEAKSSLKTRTEERDSYLDAVKLSEAALAEAENARDAHAAEENHLESKLAAAEDFARKYCPPNLHEYMMRLEAELSAMTKERDDYREGSTVEANAADEARAELAAMTKERDVLKSELALLPTNHVDYTEQIATLTAALSRFNAPEIHDFIAGVEREAAHQRQRWGDEHDKNKTPDDWLWALAFLATKATQAARYGDRDKHLHHIITAAALLANWHRIASANKDKTDA